MARKPAVTGTFYPADSRELEALIDKQLRKAEVGAMSECKAFVAPHAAYAYSGGIAAYTYAALQQAHAKKKFDTIVIIGPNHTGYGRPIAISQEDWQTPLGIVKNDKELSQLIAEMPDMYADEIAHAFEHSVEVQLPFLQKAIGEINCVFICMGDQSYEASVALSQAIMAAAKKKKRNIAVIASSDFNHYESAVVAKKKDAPAIDAALKLDPEGFHELIKKNNDTACGYGPITVAAIIARRMGAKSGMLLKYATSGDTTNDYDSVVAYASIVFA
ncbi:MAG: MEMO1 family protein [Candidatus Micrarchaeota archaeon]|nr:MEMO1 family protein [Candidatus Micrarchaeota archaeon]